MSQFADLAVFDFAGNYRGLYLLNVMEAGSASQLLDAFAESGHLLSRDRILLVEGNLAEDQFSGGFVLRARQCWDFRALCSQHARRLAMTVDLRDLSGASVFSRTLAPRFG